MLSHHKTNGSDIMKVFISWSGNLSKKVALIFRDWLPTVIQAIDPFVSSEDIEKGARWNTDIAQELKEASFGLICVTKDNLNSQWLNFEAGALSKSIDNSYVAPLLFDVKPSDLTSSPISQFQATSFSKEDMKRLIETLNKATGNSLNAARLDKAFELCYPDLEKSIAELQTDYFEDGTEDGVETVSHYDPNILEEILETSRNTQRLLGNTDSKLYSNIDLVNNKVDDLIEKTEKHFSLESRRSSKRMSPTVIEDLLFSAREKIDLFPYNILLVLSVYKEEFPWLYEAGNDFAKTVNSKCSKQAKTEAIGKLEKIIECTYELPVYKEMTPMKKECMMLLRELPRICYDMIERLS